MVLGVDAQSECHFSLRYPSPGDPRWLTLWGVVWQLLFEENLAFPRMAAPLESLQRIPKLFPCQQELAPCLSLGFW